jgi:hypothetical protein
MTERFLVRHARALTRASILLSRKMDCRVEPGNDD